MNVQVNSINYIFLRIIMLTAQLAKPLCKHLRKFLVFLIMFLGLHAYKRKTATIFFYMFANM